MSKVVEMSSMLPSSYKNATCTLKSASADDTNDVQMVDSSCCVLDYDEVAKKHQQERHYSFRLSSTDAVYITNDGIIYFIEFKNGTFEKIEIAKKGIGSAMLAMDLGLVNSMKELQCKAVYILVYNPSVIEAKQTESQKKLSSNLRKKSKGRITCLPVLKEVAWIYRDAFSYTIEEFKSEFVQKIIEPEYLTASS